MTTQLVYSNEFQQHDNPSHPENAQRLTTMLKDLKQSPLYPKLNVIAPQLLKEDILYDVHSRDMIHQIKTMSLQEENWIDLDTYVCKSDYKIARLAAGGLLNLTKNVLENKAKNGFALVRPPGHHATKDQSMGFCLFNNIAIAANELTKTHKKVLIFDLDVHHGNGTQEIFYDRSDVLYQSFHLSPHYPGTGSTDEIGIKEGKGYTINAPLHQGNGDSAVSNLLENIFLPIAKNYKPDLILVSCGYDSHHADRLGGLKLTANYFGDIIKQLQTIQPKIVCTLEGGYNLKWLGKCLISQLAQLSHQQINIEDSADETDTSEPVIIDLKNQLKNIWDI